MNYQANSYMHVQQLIEDAYASQDFEYNNLLNNY